MESNCEENVKRIELEWISGDRDWEDMLEYREKNDKEWLDKEFMCYVLREDVFELIDWRKLHLHSIINDICLSSAVNEHNAVKLLIDSMLNQLNTTPGRWDRHGKATNDIFIMGKICLSSAVNVQNALKRLIDSMQNQLSSNSSKWARHGKACEVIKQVLRKCKDRYESHDYSSQQVYAQIFDYMMKLIEMCEDEETIDSALSALEQFPFNEYQSSLLKLVNFIGNKLNTDKCGWQTNSYDIIENVLRKTKGLNQQTCDRLVDYFKKLIDCCEDDETIESAWKALRQFPVKQISSQVYQPLIQNYLLSSQLNLRMHRNWLIGLFIQWWRYSEIFEENEMKMWFEYLRNVLHKCDHVELVSLAIRLVEVLCLREYFDVESEDVLKSELMGRVQSLDSECPLASDLPDDFDFYQYQMEWKARWCVHNVMDRDKRKEMGGKLPLVKLSNDRFEARNDQIGSFYDSILVRSQYSVTSGVYFYEVTLATSGEMMFGWSTRDAEFGELYNGRSRKLICQPDGDYIFVHLPNFHAGDVIGCLMNTDKRRFVFYCNGKEVVSDDEMGEFKGLNQVIFSSSPYYATSRIFSKRHCYFNFGQTSFKFPPNHIQFMDFHSASGKDERKYRLAETSKTVDNLYTKYWFKHLPVDNQVDLFYRDKRQNECDELVMRVERDIAEGREVEEMKMRLGCDRYIQTIIEEMGNTIQKDKIDLMAQWVGRVIEETIENKNKAKLLQLLYPYLHLQINSTLDYTKHRNICIVLSNLIRFSEWYGYDFIKYIRNEVFTYLTRTLTETSDQWTQLFGLIALHNLKLKEEEKKMIQEDIRIMTFLKSCKNSSQYSNVFEMSTLKQSSPLSYQLHFMSEYFHRNVLNRPINLNQSNQASLNIKYQTRYLKVSHDLLTVRSDWKWQSVRYECSGENRIDYFEVLLLTNGPMRIGWSTKRTELKYGEKLGSDEFSISFNGHSRVMYHQNSPSPTHCMPQWKAGDVVACLMHISTGRFYFLLNGHPLPLPDKLYFSPHLPYYPSLSLSAHQQVYSNFGQTNFRYPQPNIESLDLKLFIQKEFRYQPNTSIDLSHSSIRNSFLAIQSKAKTRNISFNHQSQSTVSPSNVNNNNKRELISPSSSFITCQTCHKQISTKRLKSDCCEHFEFATEPQPVESTSTIAHENDAQQQIVMLNEELSKCKYKIEELENENKTIKVQGCDNITSVCAITNEHDLQQQNVMLMEENIRCKERIVVLEEEIKTVKAKLDQIRAFVN